LHSSWGRASVIDCITYYNLQKKAIRIKSLCRKYIQIYTNAVVETKKQTIENNAELV